MPKNFSFWLRQHCLLLALTLFLPAAFYAQQRARANELKAPVQVMVTSPLPVDLLSDGCTMWFDADFRDCCVKHDADYLTGATDWHGRLRADNHLFLCITDKKGFWHKLVAPVMWSGVRVFGSDWLPVSSRNVVHKYAKRAFRSFGKRTRPAGDHPPPVST